MAGETPTALKEMLAFGTFIHSFIYSTSIYRSPISCQAKGSVLGIEQENFLNCLQNACE